MHTLIPSLSSSCVRRRGGRRRRTRRIASLKSFCTIILTSFETNMLTNEFYCPFISAGTCYAILCFRFPSLPVFRIKVTYPPSSHFMIITASSKWQFETLSLSFKTEKTPLTFRNLGISHTPPRSRSWKTPQGCRCS